MPDTSVNVQRADVFAVEALSAELEGLPFAWFRGPVDVWPFRLTKGWRRDVQDIRPRVDTLENDYKRHESGNAITEYDVAGCGQ